MGILLRMRLFDTSGEEGSRDGEEDNRYSVRAKRVSVLSESTIVTRERKDPCEKGQISHVKVSSSEVSSPSCPTIALKVRLGP